MSTSAPAVPTRHQPTPAAPDWPPLWPQPITIVGGTGDKFQGKTKFGLNICPGRFTTLVYDFEQSSAGYEEEYRRIGVPFERVDVQRVMHDLYPHGYKPVQLWEWWLADMERVPAGKYRVIVADPVTDLERGLTDWVDANPKAFGHTEQQYARMSGIKWGDVKDYWKMKLAAICAKCQTFYFVAHIGAEFKGGTATGEKKVKGKETLFELASLYLWFERPVDPQKGRQQVPSAKVLKGRQELAEVIDGEVASYSVLPDRLPVATPRAVRDYFKNPVGKRPLTEAEKLRDETVRLSADERLKLEVQKAEAEAEAAQAKAAYAAAAAPVVLGSRATEFEKTIRAATSADSLRAEVAPNIKVAFEAGELSQPEVDYLRTVFNDAGRRLKAAETQA